MSLLKVKSLIGSTVTHSPNHPDKSLIPPFGSFGMICASAHLSAHLRVLSWPESRKVLISRTMQCLIYLSRLSGDNFADFWNTHIVFTFAEDFFIFNYKEFKIHVVLLLILTGILDDFSLFPLALPCTVASLMLLPVWFCSWCDNTDVNDATFSFFSFVL